MVRRCNTVIKNKKYYLDNQIGVKGAEAIAAMLEKNNTITNINLSGKLL